LYGEVELVMHLGIEPGYSLFYNRRRGLLYDARYQPACRAPSRGRVSFHMLLSGSISTSNGLEASGPALVRMAEDVFEGALGTRPASFRGSGEPHISLTLHIDGDRAKGGVPKEPELVPLSADVERAARAYCQLAEANAGAAACERASALLIGAFARDGFVEERHDDSTRRSVYAERIWNGLNVFVEKLDAAPTLAMLSDLVDISPRTADRFLKHLTEGYGLPAEGYRDLIRRWRLKLATLLLTSRELTVRVVAKRVGYRNAEALANALAAEGLLAPSRYRQLWEEDYLRPGVGGSDS
jgi:AraC-like DNA-binding protein